MVPEILIVGEPDRRGALLDHVRALRYEVSFCGARDLARRVREGPSPGAVIICTEDEDAPLLLAGLRRTRQGAAVPVLLHGHLGDEIRDLADVLDLGADGFVDDPPELSALRDALLELTGPASGRTETGIEEPAHPATRARRRGAAEWRDRGGRTERLSGATETRRVSARADVKASRDRTGSVEPTGSVARPGRPEHGGVLGSLHKTLDRLEARLRSRDEETGEPEPRIREDIDLSELGLDDIPDVEPEGDELDPADSAADLSLPDLGPVGGGDGVGAAGAAGRGGSAGPRGAERTSRIARDEHPAGRARWDGGARQASEVLDDRAEERGGVRRGRRPSRPDDADARARVRGGDAREAGDWRRRRASEPGAVAIRAGELSPGEVPRMLWRLHEASFTGSLQLRHGQGEKRIWLADGHVVFVRSTLSSDRFVDGLLRRGVLTRPQYDTARRLAAKEPRRVGRLLVDAGFLKPDEVGRLLREHLGRVLQGAFSWEQGSWRLEPGDEVDEAVLLDAPMAALIYDGLRFELDERQLQQQVVDAYGDRSARVRLGATDRERARLSSGLSEQLRLAEGRRHWLAGLDGRRALHELWREPGIDGQESLALLLTLRIMAVASSGDLAEGGGGPPARDPVQVDADRLLERLRLAREADYFELLGLGRDATRGEVRRAHAELDATFRDEVLEEGTIHRYGRELEELRAALEEARDILMDDAMRSAYLAHLGDPSTIPGADGDDPAGGSGGRGRRRGARPEGSVR